jgi:hypothetical protein
MPIRIFRGLLPAVLVLLCAKPASAQRIRALVSDGQTGAAVPEALVRVEDRDGRLLASAFSGTDGIALLQLRGAGTYRVTARRGGYRLGEVAELAVAAPGETAVALRLAPAPVALDTLQVIARSANERGRQGFARRRETSAGVFLDSAYLSRVDARHVNDYLGEVPGIYLDRNNRLGEPRARSTRGWRCMVLLVDGRPLVMQFADGGRRRLNDVIGPHHVVSVEVYRAFSEVPPEFRRYAQQEMYNCGVYLYWTRAGW